MKFAVGYQLHEEGETSFLDIVREYHEHIGEVYFPWGNMPSGRAALTTRRGYVDWHGQQRLEEDLAAIRKMGIRLDLLFNANCYGQYALSEHLQNKVGSILEHLGDVVGGVDTVTTTSPMIARTVKQYFPQIEVRASVNMRIGTIEAMRYVADLFDGYYIQRDFNRDLAYIQEVKAWADSEGKNIYLLANSGCLRCCPGQSFHDNLVAHEAEIDEMKNIANWTPHVCWNYLRQQEHWPAVLQATWIRPEDLHHYDDLFPLVKLATRMHAHPRMVVHAYVQRKFRGNLLDLFEPGFSPAFAPYILDSTKFPADWFAHTSTCNRLCHRCHYCQDVLGQLLTSFAE